MELEAAKAIEAFSKSMLPDGDLKSIDVSGQVSMESEVNGFPVTVTLNPEMLVTLGDAADLHVIGSALALDFEAYCSPGRVIAITEGGEDYGVRDMSAEARNPLGFCTGPGSEQLVLPFFEFELIDPALLTGDLDLEAMLPAGFEKIKGGIAASYDVEGPQGMTTLTMTIKGGKVAKIVSSNDDGNLVLEMAYGERTSITIPEADDRVGTVVRPEGSVTNDGWSWTGIGDSGPSDEFSIAVYEKGASVPCSGGPTPIVSFAIKDGAEQSKDGWRFTYFDDGDGRLGAQDSILIRHPNSEVAAFDHEVYFIDDWAGSVARSTCATPGPGLVGVLVPLALVGLVALRRRD